MYLRFMARERCQTSHVGVGVFAAAYDRLYDDETPFWLWRDLRRTLDWFNDHLDAPTRFTPRRRRGVDRFGVCWFQPEAGRHIARARHLAWLATEAGTPVWEVRTDEPGKVVYRDPFQIVAAPGPAARRVLR